MEFSSVAFLSFSYFFSYLHSCVGVKLLFFSNSKSDHPLPYGVICALAYSMVLFTFISSAYAFLIRPSLENDSAHMSGDLASIFLMDMLYSFFTSLEQLFPRRINLFFSRINDILMAIPMYRRLNTLYRSHDLPSIPYTPLIFVYYLHTLFWVLLSLLYVNQALSSDIFVGSFLCLLVCLLFSAMHLGPVSAYLWLKERFSRFGTWPPFMWVYGIRKIMKFALGMVGSMLFQYFFRFASGPQLLALLFLAVGWLGNLAMVQPSTDAGIFNFLLANACLGCAVNLFNLDTPTWLVFAACLLLYFLGWMLDSVTLRYDRFLEFNVSLQPSSPSTTDVVVVPPVLPQTVPSFTAHDCPSPPTKSPSVC